MAADRVADDAFLRRLGAGALAIWLFTAGVQACRHDLAHLAWGCYIALLWIAGGCLRRNALANAIGTLWLCAGFPLWVVDLAQGDVATAVSTATHLGGLCLGLAAAARLGMPRGAWWKALGLTWLVQQLTLRLLPAAGDVNMAFAIWPGWERRFPSYLLFWAALMGYCGVVFLAAEAWMCRRWPAAAEAPAPRLVLPALVHDGNRGAALAFVYAAFFVTFELFVRWSFGAPLVLPMTALDRAIPLWPASIYVYFACFPYVAVGLLALRERENLNRVYASLVLAWLTAGACFMLQPTLVAAHVPSGPPLTRELFRLLDRVDDLRVHGNSFPSMHVGFTLLVAWGYRAERRRWYPWMLLLAALISASTLLAKRHYVIDAAGGVAVAWVARRVVDSFVEFRQLPAGAALMDWAPRIRYRYPPQTMERVSAETAKLTM